VRRALRFKGDRNAGSPGAKKRAGRLRPVLLTAALLLALAAGLHYAHSIVELAAAYKAKVLCSGVFVSRRPAESLLNVDLVAGDLAPLRHIGAAVDLAHDTATASFLGLIERTARYRADLGCTLVPSGDKSFRPSVSENKTAPSRTQSTGLEYRLSQATGGDKFGSALDYALVQHRLEAALDWAFAEPDPAQLRHTRAVVILRSGVVVAERYAEGFDPNMPLPGWSLAKLAMNALTGILVGEGRLFLSAPANAPEWLAPDDPRRAITLDHLLHMESGLEFSEDHGKALQDVTFMLLREPDAAAFAARKPLQAPPGTRWHYASGTSNILSRLIRRTVGEADYPGFPKRALFAPLGMDSAVLEQDASGTFVGSSFMYATARDWATLGQFYLQDGVWNGRRLLPEGWVRYSTTPAPHAPHGEYGAHFWLKLDDSPAATASTLPADAFHGIGFEGQYLSIVPSQRLVVVRLGLTREGKAWRQGEFLARVIEAPKE